MKIDLSIIILSYNTRETTLKCLTALHKSLELSKSLQSQIIIIDNASRDESQKAIMSFIRARTTKNVSYVTIFNEVNHGYTKGNNQGIKRATDKFVLFLNSDAIIQQIDFVQLLSYLDKDPQIGALTTKVVLPSGEIDPASHRGFPTPWNAASYFLNMEKVFGKIPILRRVFGGYHLTYMDLTKIHEIDSPTGAFYLVRKDMLDKIGGFDEKNFFMYGEDLDLSYRIKSAGYKIIYYPEYSVLHIKHQSGLGTSDAGVRRATKAHFYDSMKIFYKKHYEKRYPSFLRHCIYYFIDIKKKLS